MRHRLLGLLCVAALLACGVSSATAATREGSLIDAAKAGDTGASAGRLLVPNAHRRSARNIEILD